MRRCHLTMKLFQKGCSEVSIGAERMEDYEHSKEMR